MEMKKIHEIIKERDVFERYLIHKTKKFEEERDKINSKIKELLRLEKINYDGLDLERVQIAEKLIRISGNPFGKTSSVTTFGHPPIAEIAIIDIAYGCKHLKTQYFGNKRYESYYQRSDCEYGYGPRHGYIVDRIELINRKVELSDEEKDACIYYIKNYNIIKDAKK